MKIKKINSNVNMKNIVFGQVILVKYSSLFIIIKNHQVDNNYYLENVKITKK